MPKAMPIRPRASLDNLVPGEGAALAFNPGGHFGKVRIEI